MERLDKWITLGGYTRSEAKKVITAGRVSVKGAVVRTSSAQARLEDVLLDGKPLSAPEEITLMLNKPAGIITATSDAHMTTVMDLLPEKYASAKLGPVGRLDRDVTGLVLLTENGELAHRLISPKRKAEKHYIAVCEGRLTEADVEAFAKGLQLSDFTAKPAILHILRADDETSEAEVVLHEGKFHQVKRMFAAVAHPLVSLKRTQIGCVTLDPALAEGKCRELTREECDALKALVGIKE